ncbi:MAG: hypothetical protein FWD68_10470 [Alphaproteobacteria bacterium]|nr:hypothetical protein [Alphaproteobacteria bacterium]
MQQGSGKERRNESPAGRKYLIFHSLHADFGAVIGMRRLKLHVHQIAANRIDYIHKVQSTFPFADAEFVISGLLHKSPGSDSVALVQRTMMTSIEASYF